MQIIFATQNPNKVKEIQNQIGDIHKIVSLLDLYYLEELEETQETLEGNALQKARFVFNKFGKACFADDTGLEIEALNGEPGIYSARYGGTEKSFEKNMDLVLSKLEGQTNRKAQFRTAIALLDKNGKEHLFEGVCKGEILKGKIGEGGFGYDPIFRPEGYQETFAQLSMETKNKISHRGIAVSNLIKFLKA
ncbi:MAG: XTP/dITP diphosphohydrolase [Vicingaceae bacterium]|jgi:XTP/dITP diphosphohydrolase